MNFTLPAMLLCAKVSGSMMVLSVLIFFPVLGTTSTCASVFAAPLRGPVLPHADISSKAGSKMKRIRMYLLSGPPLLIMPVKHKNRE